MIKEHDRVVLLKDVPDEGLKTGDVGTVVHKLWDGKTAQRIVRILMADKS